jgi:uncharacterized membrane protein YkvA (DUF1232 family)
MAKTQGGEKRITRRERSGVKQRLRSFLMFLPNMVRLLGRLLKDSRVPTAEKALVAAAIVYVISPIDLIPDFFPFIGQVDDLYVVSLVLLRLINRTDDSIVRQHWPGGGDIVALADSIANIAPKFLPRRVSRVITSRVEMAPAEKILRSITHKDEPIVREIAVDENISIDAHSKMAN